MLIDTLPKFENKEPFTQALQNLSESNKSALEEWDKAQNESKKAQIWTDWVSESIVALFDTIQERSTRVSLIDGLFKNIYVEQPQEELEDKIEVTRDIVTSSAATFDKNIEIVRTLSNIESFISKREEQIRLQEEQLKEDFKAVVASTNDFKQLKAFTDQFNQKLEKHDSSISFQVKQVEAYLTVQLLVHERLINCFANLKQDKTLFKYNTRDLLIWVKKPEQSHREDFRWQIPESYSYSIEKMPTVTFITSHYYGLEALEVNEYGLEKDSILFAEKGQDEKQTKVDILLNPRITKVRVKINEVDNEDDDPIVIFNKMQFISQEDEKLSEVVAASLGEWHEYELNPGERIVGFFGRIWHGDSPRTLNSLGLIITSEIN